MSSRIGLPTNLFHADTVFKSVRKLKSIDVSCVEVVFEAPQFSAEGKRPEDRPAKLKELLASSSLEVSLHAPYFEVNLGSLHTEIRRFSLKHVKRSIAFAGRIAATVVTVHPGFLPLHTSKRLWLKAKARFIQDLNECAIYARDCGVKLCIENIHSRHFFCSTLPEVARLARKIEYLGVTLDVGHAFIYKHASQAEAPEKEIADETRRWLKGHLHHLHIHDNQGILDAHSVPGDGKIDFQTLAQALKEISYTGQIIVEIWNPADPVAAARKALKKTEELFG